MKTAQYAEGVTEPVIGVSALCDACQEKWDGWTTYQAPVGRWMQYPISAARSMEAKSTQLRERAELIDWQCRMIRTICFRDHNYTEECS